MSRTDIVIPRKASFLKKVWALAWPYFWSEEKWAARGLLALVVALNLGQVFLDVVLNYWNNDFGNAIQKYDEAAFWRLILKFFIIAIPYLIVYVYATYLQQMLQIRWRKWMTDRTLQHWLTNRNYYRLQLKTGDTDNPEQRIEQDINQFTGSSLDLSLGLMSSVVTLVSFITILWTLSGDLNFAVAGINISIPGYMVWVALLYAAAGSFLTYLVGRPLIRTNFELQRSNATFRFGMTRLRENAENVAFYGGEESERREIMILFGSVWRYWGNLMRQQKRLNFFIIFYRLLANIFPTVVASPRYFSKAISLGGLSQIGSAFGSVQGALSWFVSSFTALADWKATVDRLIGFVDTLERVEAEKPEIDVALGANAELAADDLNVSLPDGRQLIRDLSARIEAGDRVLVSGPSGSGKTTLFRTLAGLWPYGGGTVHVPTNARVLFLPQRPYLPMGTLRHALCYPAQSGDIPDVDLKSVLDEVHLSALKDRLDENANWTMTLSIGEQQRLAIARALLLKPEWLYLDEATAALDADNEKQMYELLKRHLPDATILSIAHREAVARYHTRRLAIDPESRSAALTPLAAE
ncbi:MAG TPA: ABC transporter ATP-binding protein/permease [Candidatus Binatia bacterium]|nr:ABC transporter ATP-binding protein/permease [Candidatus Binatia bacterium]